jgi:hypothetical protein
LTKAAISSDLQLELAFSRGDYHALAVYSLWSGRVAIGKLTLIAGEAGEWSLPPKTLNSDEDAHPPEMSTFGKNEHLRTGSNGTAPAGELWPDIPPCLDRRSPKQP